MKVLSVIMANGLQAIDGPRSVRINDIDSVHVSDLDGFLTYIQANDPIKYCAFGDGIFHPLATDQSTIRSYHCPAPEALLTNIQLHENKCMRNIRMHIEFSYGDIYNRFKTVRVKNDLKIMNNANEMLNKKLLFLFFLSNCMTCIGGNTCSNYFECRHPTLREYLNLPPQP